MEVWILFNEDIDATSAEAFEVRRFMEEGEAMGIDVKVYHPEQFELLVTAEHRHSALINGKLVPLPDYVLPRTYLDEGGYFSLAVLRHLERLGVPVFNRSRPIEVVGDKLHTHQILLESSLPTPTTLLAKFPIDIEAVEESIGFPLVMKTLRGVNGEGVFLIEDHKSFKDMIDLTQQVNPDVLMIFQEFIADSMGRDLRLFVVDGEVIGAMERRAPQGSFKANYTQGASVSQFIPDQEAKMLAVKAAELLKLQVAGVDLLYTENGYTICEVNSFPGFKGLESCCDVNVPQEIFGAMCRNLCEALSDNVEPFRVPIEKTQAIN